MIRLLLAKKRLLLVGILSLILIYSFNKSLSGRRLRKFQESISAFDISSDICGSDRVDFLILVGSKPENAQIREAYRSTWQIPERYFRAKVVFFLGRADEPAVDKAVEDEARKYGDIVRGDNAAYYVSELMRLRWATRRCDRATYVMKTEDNVLADIDTIYEKLLTKMPAGEDFIACFRILVYPQGNKNGTACQGLAYWMNMNAVRLLDKKSLTIPPSGTNDLYNYITGTLAASMGWKLRLLDVKYELQPEFLKNILQRGNMDRYRIGISNDKETIKNVHEYFYNDKRLKNIE